MALRPKMTKIASRGSCLKGSVERSLHPSAIFLIFTRKRPWKSEDHFCTLFFIEISKDRLEKSERTPLVSWRPWALAYSRDWPYNLSCLSAMSKNGLLRIFSSALGCYLARKSLWWPAMSVSNKKQAKSLSSEKESNCSMTSECVRTDSILPRGAGREHGRCKQSIFLLSIFGILVEWLSFKRLHFCSDFVTVFFIVFVYARAKVRCYRFLISVCEKSYASSKLTG